MVEEAEVSKWIKEKAGPKASLYLDSRRIQPGDVFFAVCGTHTDGRKFVAKAAELGASCAVVESADHFKADIPFIEVCDLYKNAVQSLPITTETQVRRCTGARLPERTAKRQRLTGFPSFLQNLANRPAASEHSAVPAGESRCRRWQ